jgi:redox-sensitive bicupin YhaK (pirin superfamily)
MTNNTDLVQARDAVKLVHGHETSDGAGVRLLRYIASPSLDMLDPFLLLDVFRSDDPKDYIAGFPPHPHRGFETVTYLLEGRVKHRDSAGHEGIIKPGGVQWMTAGRGIEHSEMPEQEEGLLYGFQLWVNLPSAKKMMPPRYQEFEPEAIPEALRENGVRLRVIAGTSIDGLVGPVQEIATNPMYFDVSVPQDKTFSEVIPAQYNAFIYMVNGNLEIVGEKGTTTVASETLVVLGNGDHIFAKAQSEAHFLLVAGQPLNEAVVRYGPFVMNTEDEIRQAIADHRDGQFGQVINE